MEGAFQVMDVFNQPITILSSTLLNAPSFVNDFAFNSLVSIPNAKPTNFGGMFVNCTLFNQPLDFNFSEASGQSSTNQMLENADAFDQAVNFNAVKLTTVADMFRFKTPMSATNTDQWLISLEAAKTQGLASGVITNGAIDLRNSFNNRTSASNAAVASLIAMGATNII
jgi:hypothetical protein